MPELPEVETVRRGLVQILPGMKVTGVEVRSTKSFPNEQVRVDTKLINASITAVRRRAKILLIDLSTDFSLAVHLKMTGQLVFRGTNGTRFGAGHPNDSLVGDLPDRSTRVIVTLNDGRLFFNDQRKFGWMRLLPTGDLETSGLLKSMGPEPLEPSFTFKVFKERLIKRPTSVIKAALIDQTVIAGIGNIYADESLFAARLHPATRVRDVSPAKLRTLYNELLRILELSLEKGGASDRNYVDAHGKKGSFTAHAQVYKRKGEPCFRCGTPIQRIVVAGRGTHICPHCQRLTRKTK
ncbi:MAG TPA: bifunctional DNA-formamidopyrimidine glycosylase/DNA-(apurinic or apyrimidinic site) lyase [Candidatus Saccharimonadales bacterium]|nr:bifunctional DNA-formamidopyrimidine glycosylase/DNA-(apurinic or apyrimidinic site) lyase [Candidatus Saccharimonadales bacterium]